MDTAKSNAFPPPVPTVTPPIDPLMHERLARLTASRAGRDGATRIPPAANGNRPPAASSGNRKRHPAKGSRTAAVLMSLATTAGLAAYFQRVDSASATDGASTLTGTATASGTATAAATATTAATAATSASTTPATTATTAPSASTASTTAATTATTAPATTAATTAASGLADGTYTGATSTNRWGPVQVEITVSGGQITQAVALQTPSADRKSVSINARATPKLAAEVLSAQTATIDTVSGATYTSKSYRASLQSAIDLARATAAQAGASS